MLLGEARYNVVFNKRRRNWIVRKLYASRTKRFQDELMDMLVKRKGLPYTPDDRPHMTVPDLPKNLGSMHRNKPSKETAVSEFQSRFK